MTVLERRKGSGRPRTILLDWLMKNENGHIGYDQLKMMA